MLVDKIDERRRNPSELRGLSKDNAAALVERARVVTPPSSEV